MESNEVIDLTPYDQDAVISLKSEKQHRVNAERALHYLGLDPTASPDIYTANAIYHFIDSVISKTTPQSDDMHNPDQYTFDDITPHKQ